MSKVNIVQMSASASTIEQVQKGKGRKRRKSEKMRLPTPPPDPTLSTEASISPTSETDAKLTIEKEADFLEYLDNLQRSPMFLGSRCQAQFAPAEATEHAINHLDKLYKLMGQMLTLREQNILLHRRIMDLERFRSMQCMDKQLDLIAKTGDLPRDDHETANAESLLYDILVDSKKESQNMQTRARKSIARKSFKLRRTFEDNSPTSRRISMASYFGNKPAKVSKWTKVKAAFKWEKAEPASVSYAKSQDSGLGMVQPVNCEVARYLRVPSTSEEVGISPADSGAAEVSTPGTLSSASSVEELHQHHRQHGRRRAIDDTSDDDPIFSYDYIPCTKDEPSTSKADNKPRTPWSKVKDIIQIQTRNSLMKRHRLSTKSDDFKLEDGLTPDSDNEEVFESEDTEKKSPILIIQSPEEISKENAALSWEHNIPIDIIARYRMDNDENCGTTMESKWVKVKRAFLTSPSSSKNDSSSPTTPEPLTKCEPATHEKEHDDKLQAEIQQNYLKLQKKLSLEFQEKLQEWERSKFQNASVGLNANAMGADDPKELAFKKKMEEWQKIKGQPKHNMQLKSEENLPPEFRKKLEEWKKIKKTSVKEDKRKTAALPKWKSFGSPKTDLENVQLTDDFRKKYESWRHIKSGATTPEEPDKTFCKGNKSPSPKLLRRIGSRMNKHSDDKELQWLDKGIERERQRLERDKHKFLEREQRLSKLRRSLVGHNKKEVLVQTPSGLYRFEGISRKFTQKLYEWEKARGIRPEESTFALLNSSCIPHIEAKDELVSGILMRSKSADSIMNAEQLCPLLSQRPSSLSLNELDKLEEEMLLGETVPDIIRSSENNEPQHDLHDGEPEAVIVEVEDIVEETAAFAIINTFTETHYPIYQKQEINKLYAGESNVGPTIRRSESRRAQENYNLIEEIIEALNKLAENENDIDDVERRKTMLAFSEFSVEMEQMQNLKLKEEQQKRLSEAMIEKLIYLQDANSNVAVNITREETNYKMAEMVDVLDTIQDLTTELFSLAESIDHFIYKRNKTQLENNTIIASRSSFPQIAENLYSMKMKILELRRNLSYLCAASDIAVATFKQKEGKPLLRKSSSTERKRNLFRKSRSRDSREEPSKEMTNSPTLRREIEQGAVKKRMRYRQKELHTKTLDESDDDEDALLLQEQRKAKPRRVRSQNSTESNKSETKKPEEHDIVDKPPIIVDPEVIDKILVPTKSTLVGSFEELNNTTESTTCISQEDDSAVAVFVKTTRKLFTPIGMSSGGTKSTDDDRAATPSTCSLTSTTSSCNNNNIASSMNVESMCSDAVTHLPPIPSSPVPQRKFMKEISPNIRMMMVRYNQKINEEAGIRSGGSSGSASPVAWRSPVLERRVKAQTEKYQQELQKMSPLLGRREVKKSASMGLVVAGNKQVTIHKQTGDINPKGILKSCSTSFIKPDYSLIETIKAVPPIPEVEDRKIPDERTTKLQRAKEEFLNGIGSMQAAGNDIDSSKPCSEGCSSSQNDENNTKPLRYPAKNRLSQVSVRSDVSTSSSSYGVLMKSASVGMINIDAESYKQFNPEVHGDGYVSLPRSAKKNLLSNIKSKIRNVKMRRNKDKDKEKVKMNTVSTLCRQSLMVDIKNSSQETLSEDQASKLSIPSDSRGSSTDTSPSTSRTSSWIKRSKIFNSKKN